MAHALDVEEPPIGRKSDCAQLGQIVQAFADPEVISVVDGRLGRQGAIAWQAFTQSLTDFFVSGRDLVSPLTRPSRATPTGRLSRSPVASTAKKAQRRPTGIAVKANQVKHNGIARDNPGQDIKANTQGQTIGAGFSHRGQGRYEV